MEYVEGGEFLRTLIDHKGFSEEICRYYFKQLLAGVINIHSQGVAHRDLKPDNILLCSKTWDLKITDFGFMIPLEGRNSEGLVKSKVGTSAYMAPEILALKTYHGKSADIYALGVILFILRFANMPMEIARSVNRFYKMLKNNQIDEFWKEHQAHAGVETSDEFKDLVNSMIHPDPEMRLDFAEIIVSPWMKGECATKEQVNTEMERRE